MADLYDHPNLYDELWAVGAHLPFYLDLARQQQGTVLELACGTGQLTIPIALTGLPTVGVDASSAMLTAARRRASAVDAPVTFIQDDMRTVSLDRQFDLIFVARNSLLHLLTTADLISALTVVRRHLTPGGLFAFDVFNPDVRLLARSRGQRVPMMDVETASFGRVSVDDTPDYDAATQVNSGTMHVSTADRRDAWTLPMVLRSIFPQELPLLLSAAGLELSDRFGDLSRGPFSGSSRMQVCFCKISGDRR
jgi:SAM-dependent methyltransferase